MKRNGRNWLPCPKRLLSIGACTPNLNEDGISYTLDKKRAEWFSKRFRKDGTVVQKVVRKKRIVAYLDGRNEQEVVVL